MIFWSGWYITWILITIQLFSLVIFAAFADATTDIRQNIKKHIRSGYWLIGFYLMELAISYLGSFGGIGVIPYPYDNFLVIIGAIIVFYWGVNTALDKPLIDHDPVEGDSAE